MNSQNNTDFIPKLDEPGAGIPLLNRLVLRLLVKPFVAARSPWQNSKNIFLKVSEKIILETEGLTSEQLAKRILVKPLPGLEDSSRYWSIGMAIEHLNIVGKKMLSAITDLAQEKNHAEIADTAKVKPLGEIPPNKSIEDFRKFVRQDFPLIEKYVSEKDSVSKHTHPWFGPMTARQWYWLLGVHQGLHLRQIREIKKSL